MMGLYDDICGLSIPVLAGLAFLFSVGFLLQILVQLCSFKYCW
jgi:hypothetical protein